MNKFYILAIALVSAGVACAHISGVIEAEKQRKRLEARTWSDAGADNPEMGNLDDVRGERDGINIAGNPA